ncbi:MAG: methionyl-tRNA formyltransferase [Patescibacteria group bacterium]|nr:methionyl-tRNA formyltransferase [Patescibacteria group bacterium]
MAYKIVFFGTSDFSTPSLEALLKDTRFEVVAVVTKPDAPIGRHQTLTPPPVKVIAQEHDVQVFQFEKIKTDESYDQLRGFLASARNDGKVDAYVVVSYGKIIPQRILDLPKHGCINVHGSLLPLHRGASCVQAAIAEGDQKTGVTVMLMDAEMDHGDILAQKEIAIGPEETGGQLHNRLSQLGAETLPDILAGYLDGKITPQPQDHSLATYCKLLSREDGKLDWTKSAAEIERLVRAYNPWPGTWTEWAGKRIKILKTFLSDLTSTKKAGELNVQNDKLVVICGDGNSLEILELQPEGKRAMTAKEFIVGRR